MHLITRPRALSAFGLGILLAACAARPPRAVPPALEVVAPLPAPPEAPAVWRPVPLPPRPEGASTMLGFRDGMLVLDEVGARWFFPDDGAPPKIAPDIVSGPVLHRTHDPRGGMLFVTSDRNVHATEGPAGALRTLLRLPDTALAASVGLFRGGVSFVSADERGATTIHRVRASDAGAARGTVPSVPGYRAKQILMGPDGVGAGLFLPERVFTTRDAGSTWEPVATNGLRVTSLLADGDRVLLLPGGERDDFARSLDPVSRVLERVMLRTAPSETPSAKRAPEPPPWARGEPPFEGDPDLQAAHRERIEGPAPLPVTHRFRDVGGRHSLVATDGDEVFVAPRVDAKPSLLLRGRLGDGVRIYGRGENEPCDVVSVALCDGLVAVSCREGIRVFRGDQRIAAFDVEGPTEVAFDAALHLLSVARDPSSDTLRFRVRDLGGSDESESREAFESEGSLPRFVGGCHRPGLWLSNDRRAARWRLDGFDEVRSLPGPSVPLAVASDGSLLISDGSRLLRFPEGPETRLGKHDRGHLSFADDGEHGLFVSESGQVQQTDDGGITFTAIASPKAAFRPSVRCGGARCQLESGAFREGFVRSPSLVAPWEASPEDTRKAGPPRIPPLPPRPDGGSDASVFMRCVTDPNVFASAKPDRPFPPLEALWPRLGSFVFVGASRSAEGAAFASFGDLRGRAQTVGLAPTPIPAGIRRGMDGSTSEPEELLEVAGVVGTARTIDFGELGLARVRWSPRGPTLALQAPQRSALGEHVLIADEGVAVHHHVAGELVLLGERPPERRLFRGSGEPEGDGVLHVARDGRWLVVEALSATEVRLSQVPRSGAPQRRELAARFDASGEHGVGLLLDEPPRLALLEERADGGNQLSLRPIGDDLSLGEALPIPGAAAEAGALLDLPTCAAGAKGGLTQLRDPRPRRFEIDKSIVDGFVHRLVRVTPGGACVERTILARTATSLDARVVVLGRGGMAISTESGPGLRCEPAAQPRKAVPSLSSAADAPRSTPRPAPTPSNRTPAGG